MRRLPIFDRRLTSVEAALAGFVLTALALGISRGFPSGPWLPFFDDGVWVTMVRRWCHGARLYRDVWDNKPPGFFLYLVPWCLVRPRPDLAVTWEVSLFWGPILALYCRSLVILVRAYPLSPPRALAVGVLAAAIVGTERMGEYCSTEVIASALAFYAVAVALRHRVAPASRDSLSVALALCAACACNQRYLTFAPLYVVVWPRRGRELARDTAATVGLGLLILAPTVGLRPSDLADFMKTQAAYTLQPAAHLLDRFTWDGFTNPRMGLLALPMRWAIAFKIPISRAVNHAVAALFLGAVLYGLATRARVLAVSFVATIALVLASRSIFHHTMIQLYPFLIALGFLLFRERGRRADILVACLSGYTLLSVATDLRADRRYGEPYYHIGRSAAFRGDARDAAERLRAGIAGRPWLSLLRNATPYWLAPDLPPPANRLFHNYPWLFPRWAQDDIDRALLSGVLVAFHSSLAAPGVPHAAVLGAVRRHCTKLDSFPEPLTARLPPADTVELFDCRGEPGLRVRAESGTRVASGSLPHA